MLFGLGNALGTLQRCMTSIFFDLIEKGIKVFMDDFNVFDRDFDNFLDNVDQVLQYCMPNKLTLSWKKCHLIVQDGIGRGQKISQQGIEVDRAKVDIIYRLLPPNIVKGIRSFLGHEGFYSRFIKDFSKIAKLLTTLLQKDQDFNFTLECVQAFKTQKECLV